jgi:hypothetical protein
VLEELDSAWNAQWPDCEPLGFLFAGRSNPLWVRFHHLPESKRYPDSEEEYQVILGRYHALLAELGLGDRCFVTAAFYPYPDLSGPLERSAILPRSRFWRMALQDPDGTQAHVFATEVAHPSEELDAVIRLVVDEELTGTLILPPDASWLVHAYDGGADVVSASTERRDELRERFIEWVPDNVLGL